MKRFKAMEDELCDQTRQLLRHFLPAIESQLRERTGDETKAKIKIEVLFDDDDKEGLHMMTTAKVELPKQAGHSVKLQWNRSQMQLFGQAHQDDDIPVEEMSDEERELERQSGEVPEGEDQSDAGPAEADVELT